MKAFHTRDLALVKHAAIVSDYTVTALNPEEPEGHEQLQAWIKKAHSVYGKVLETITTHLDGIYNYFSHRTTSGVMEGINNRIKLIKRQAYGFVNFVNFRSRLLACLSH